MNSRTKKRLLLALRISVSVGLLALVLRMVPLRDGVVFLDDGGAETAVYGEIENRADIDPALDFVVRIRPTGEDQAVAVPRTRIVGGLDGIRWGLLPVIANVRLPLLLAAFIPLFLGPLVTALRWHALMRAQGIGIRFGRTLQLNWAGLFFNNVMFGLTGGDVIKAWFISRETPLRAAAITTVFLDRVIGIVGMFLMAAVAALFVLNVPELRGTALFIFALMGATVVGSIVFFSRRLRRRLGVEWLLARVPLAHHAQTIDRAVMLYRGHPWTLFWAVVWSLVNQGSLFFGLYVISLAMGISVPAIYFFVLPPIVTLVSSLPINVGGWGVGEWMFAQLFGMVGVGAAAAVSLSVLFRICQTVLTSLPGAFMIPGPRPAAEQIEADVQAAGDDTAVEPAGGEPVAGEAAP